MVLSVAGVSYRPEALDNPAFASVAEWRWCASRGNQYDHNAVGVWGLKRSRSSWGSRHAVIVATFASLLDSGDGRATMVVWEHKDTKGNRLGVNLLTAPPQVMDHLCRDLATPETR